MIYRFLLLLSSLCLAQASLSAQPGPDVIFRGETDHPTDTIYFPYYNNVQMIEIDQIGAWERTVQLKEAMQPRALSWSMLIPGPLYNIYLFRHRNGNIVKAFNTSTPLDSLTLAFSKIPADKRSTGFRSLTNPDHAHRYHSGWGDYHSRMNDFKGLYLIYSDSARPYNMLFSRHTSTSPVGMIDSLGNIFLPIEYSALIPANDYILACKDNKWGMIDREKNEVVPFAYSSAGFGSQEEIIFQQQKQIHLIYDLRRKKFFPIDGAEDIDMESMRHDRYNPHGWKRSPPSLYRFRKNGLSGLMDTNYTVVTPAVYQLIFGYIDERALACRNNLFGYIDEKGSEIIPCMFTYAEFFREGVAVVQHEGRFRNIDKNGKLLETNVRTHETWWNNNATYYTKVGALKAIQTATGMGLAGAGDVFVIPPIYQDIRHISVYRSGQYVASTTVFQVRQHDKVGIMDTAGNILLPIRYEMVSEHSSAFDFRVVKEDEEHWGVVNRNFQIVVPCEYAGIGSGYDLDYFLFWKNGHCGMMDTSGAIIVPAIYKQIGNFKNNRAFAVKDTLYGMINRQGEVIIPFEYQLIFGEYTNGLMAFRKNNLWGYMDTTSTIIIPAQFEECRRFESDIAGVKKNGKWGFIDRKGKLVVDYQYDFVGHDWYPDGTCEVQRGEKRGYVNSKGKVVIPVEYDNSWGFSREQGHYLEKNGQRVNVKVE